MLIVESQCCPPIALFSKAKKNDSILIEKYENYQKRSFRNRFYLNSSQGKTLFSIPLKKGKNQGQVITDVEIAYEDDWVDHLGKFIQTNYGSSPFYEHYKDKFLSIFQKHHRYLYQLNIELLQAITKAIRMDIIIRETEQYNPSYSDENIDVRNSFKPNADFFASQQYPSYAQVYEEKNNFISGLSILDMIFCCGPETMSKL